LNAQKINESFYKISGIPEELQEVKRKFTLKIPNAYFDPMVKRGFKPDSEVFYVIDPSDANSIIIPSGLLGFVTDVPETPEYSEQEILKHIKNLNIPFELYDYQQQIVVESIQKKNQIALAATGSGKSACIYCMLSFFKSKNLKGMLLVPSVSLTTQIYNDCKEYNASDDFLESIRLIGGDNKVKELDKQITITTWQSAMLIEKGFEDFDFVIIDETHQLKLDTKAADIVYKCTNAKYRIGLTGTLPEDQIAKMSIMACTGKPKRYIKTQGLIERGLATPVNINVIRLMYNNDDKAIFKHVGNYTKQLQFIKEHENRNILISRLTDKVTQNGNTVVLCQHVQHMQDLFTLLINIKNPDIKVEKKHIVGKHAVEFQEEYKVFYVAGATKPKDREKIFDILRTHSNCVVVSGYALMSTGLNIKTLKNIVFASPLKSYTTITQSLGRAIRLFVSKNTAEIYDFVDDLSARGRSGPFYRQYINRLNLSYIPEGFPIQEKTVIV